MNSTPLRLSRRWTHWSCSLLLLIPALAGCGGGGGSAPATTVAAPSARITLSGTLLSAAGAPLASYRVVYAPTAALAQTRRAEDTSGSISAVTDGQGRYSLSIPVSEATPGATLFVYDATGVQVQSQTITLDPSESVQTTVTTVAPPSAVLDPGARPPLPRRRPDASDGLF